MNQHVIKVKNRNDITPLFEGWQESTIWSYLEGRMGEAYTVVGKETKTAKIILGDFCFLAGEPNDELVKELHANAENGFQIIVPQNDELAKCITSAFGEQAKKVMRYGIKKEGDIFDHKLLRKYSELLPLGLRMSEISPVIYDQIMENNWSEAFCNNFKNYDDFKQNGMGYFILKNGIVVAGASSYSYYSQGIEIEICTKESMRRKGLALCCGAKLVLSALEKGLYPNWDAANLYSVALAQKLGYHAGKEYVSYHILPKC